MLTIITLIVSTLILSILFSWMISRSQLKKCAKIPIILIGIIIIFITIWIIISGVLCGRRECFSRKMKPEDRKLYLKLLKITGKILDDNKIKWSLVSGNLLGVYRHNKLIIPWDDDVDITLYYKDIKKGLQVLRDNLPKYGCNISLYQKKFYKIFFKNSRVKHVSKKNFKSYGWPFIDLFTREDNPDDHTPTKGTVLVDKDLPLKKIQVEGVQVYVPSKGLRSLESFKKKGLLNQCVEKNWSHQNEWPCYWPFNCKGKLKVSSQHLKNNNKFY